MVWISGSHSDSYASVGTCTHIMHGVRPGFMTLSDWVILPVQMLGVVSLRSMLVTCCLTLPRGLRSVNHFGFSWSGYHSPVWGLRRLTSWYVNLSFFSSSAMYVLCIMHYIQCLPTRVVCRTSSSE